MTARVPVPSAALLRAGLLAAVLAIVAGILGMHVMTANHASHPGQAAAGVQAAPPAAWHSAGDAAVVDSAGAAAVGHQATHGDGTHRDAAGAESCSPACPDAQESGASCIPLGNTGPLAAVPPPAGFTVHREPFADASATSAYSYIPSGPTPGGLSISRT